MQFSNRKMDCIPKLINAWLAEIKMYFSRLRLAINAKQPRTQVSLQRNVQASEPSKLWTDKEFTGDTGVSAGPSLQLVKPLSPTRLGLGHSEIYNASIWETEVKASPGYITQNKYFCSLQAISGSGDRKLDTWSLRPSRLTAWPFSGTSLSDASHPIVLLPQSCYCTTCRLSSFRNC
jgi:hypothetical protein